MKILKVQNLFSMKEGNGVLTDLGGKTDEALS